MNEPAPIRELDRRRFLGLGGMSVLGAALAGGCSGGHRHGPGSTTTTTRAPDPGGDVRILRTASSLEHYMVGVYMEAAGLNLLKSPMALDVVKFFADHHSQHAGAFEGATARIGGQPFTQANPVLSRMAAARIAALRSETDVLRMAYEMEGVAAATHFSATGVVVIRPVNATLTSVGAVEARHVAVLAALLGETPPYSADGFAVADGALTAGVGV
ncbi:MAG: ferritin-like domain-containing protein [Acidimicrobiales bacterium]